MSTAVATPAARRVARPRRWMWAALIAGLLIVAALAALPLINEPLRRRMEATLNANLDGYTARLPELELRPWALSLALVGLSVRQNAHPEPPVIEVRRLAAGVHWRALLSLRLVADLEAEGPRLHVDRRQLEAEAGDQVAIQDKGWQDAIASIYPLRFNEVRIRDGSVTYIDDPRRPVELTAIEVLTTNIRNVRSEAGTFPSPLRLQATAFGSGRLSVDGAADYLAAPDPAVRAEIALREIPLERAAPVADDVSLRLRGGVLSADGSFETVAGRQHARLRTATVAGLAADYIHDPGAQATERAERLAKASAELAEEPGLRLDVEQLHLVDAALGVVNRSVSPTYRLFLDHADIRILNVSNQPAQGRGWVMVKGRFMGSGDSELWTSFVADQQASDVNVAVQIRDTDMRDLNDLFRAHAGLDVVGGRFSFFSELYASGGRIDGYVKPLFADADIYDTRQERDDGLGQKLYEGLAGGVATLLENRDDRTATRAAVSGRTDAPRLSTWEAIVNLVRNAFFDAILPGLEHARMGTRAATVIGTEPQNVPAGKTGDAQKLPDAR